MVQRLTHWRRAMKMSNTFDLKVLACAAVSIVLTVGFSWSFVESTAVVYGMGGERSHHTLSVEGAHGGAPLAPFGAALAERSATLVS
jgi:hypothetical protein